MHRARQHRIHTTESELLLQHNSIIREISTLRYVRSALANCLALCDQNYCCILCRGFNMTDTCSIACKLGRLVAEEVCRIGLDDEYWVLRLRAYQKMKLKFGRLTVGNIWEIFDSVMLPSNWIIPSLFCLSTNLKSFHQTIISQWRLKISSGVLKN